MKNNHWKVTLGALGVVYGDIGTSPLYALKECFLAGSHGSGETGTLAVNSTGILGLLSLIIWSLLLVVTVKYVIFILNADNRGEGGVLALGALIFPPRATNDTSWSRKILLPLCIFGAGLMYGDGMLTPAISVLSAVEGLSVATPLVTPGMVSGITIVILLLLFSFQRYGTEHVGKIFGPVTLVWFFVIASMGVGGILRHPDVLLAFNPYYGFELLATHGKLGLLVMGSVFLVCTGGEALYADMGHFGKKPIRMAWFIVVLPALLLNYLGQGGLLLAEPGAVNNPFYQLAPSWFLVPLIGLATCATVIASQALISGAFSLTMQAIQLGLLPRLRIDQTSEKEIGQIYIPYVNWALMIGAIGLVLGFGSSSALANAYGVAVIITMCVTTVLFFVVTQRIWKWPVWLALPLCALLITIEGYFLVSNLLKIPHGGWFPLLVGFLVFGTMMTWKKGRALVYARMKEGLLPMENLISSIQSDHITRVKGTAVYLTGSSTGVPMALLHNLKHNQVIHQHVVILHLATEECPHVSPEERVQWDEAGEGIYRVTGHFGFMEEPNVQEVLGRAAHSGLPLSAKQISYFLSRENIVKGPSNTMGSLRKSWFIFLARNARNPALFFRLQPNRVVEFGIQVQL